MALRAGMVAVVARFRQDLGNPATSVFSDDDLQAILDERSFRIAGLPLVAEDALSGNPLLFRARGSWETDAVVSDVSGAVLTADGTATDPLNGIWSFLAAPGEAVYVSGRYFDYWGAAANALEGWAARVALEFDFQTDGQQFDRSQKSASLLKVAREYGRRAFVHS